jgi:hypothetical protein
MIEPFFAKMVYDKFKNINENFQEENDWVKIKKNKEIPKNNDSDFNLGYFILWWVIYIVIMIPFAIFAVFLSWSSNSLIEWGTGFKVFFAFFAFIMPINYLFTHLIHKYDLVTHIEKQKILSLPQVN